MDWWKLSYITRFSLPKTQNVGPIEEMHIWTNSWVMFLWLKNQKFELYNLCLELWEHNSRLKNLSLSDENWEEHQVMGFEFQWKYCYYGALVSSTTMYCFIKSNWDRWLCYFSLFHFFFFLDTLFFTLIGVLASHTHNLFHFTVPSFLSLLSLLFLWKIWCIRSWEVI